MQNRGYGSGIPGNGDFGFASRILVLRFLLSSDRSRMVEMAQGTCRFFERI